MSTARYIRFRHKSLAELAEKVARRVKLRSEMFHLFRYMEIYDAGVSVSAEQLADSERCDIEPRTV